MEKVGALRSAEFLARERAVLDEFMPGLHEDLSSRSLTDLEQPNGLAIDAFRRRMGPRLLVPSEHGGAGATALEAVRVQRAIGSVAPSLAVATTMHHFSVAMLVELSTSALGFEWLLLEAIAEQDRLIASGFAEGRLGQGILEPGLEARSVANGYLVTGTKKPCSLSASMDLLTASVRLDDGSTAVAIISADSPGIERRQFWSTPILAGTESDELVLRDVVVEEQLVKPLDSSTSSGAAARSRGFLWFELLITASYLGMASAIAERVLHSEHVPIDAQFAVANEVEASAVALESVARAAADAEASDSTLLRALLVRYAAQDAIGRTVSMATEALGGMAFISSPKVAYLSAAACALAFHPPSRNRISGPLVAALQGEPLEVS